MKKVLTIITASLFLLAGTTACKTIQMLDNNSNSQSQATTSQPATKALNALPLDVLNGTWIITEAMGQKTVGDETVHIIFDTASHRIYGNNGCNTFNGSLVIGNNCAIAFADCIATMKACGPDVTDANVMKALAATAFYDTQAHSKDEAHITLLDNTGSAVATLSRQMHDKLNGQWTVIEINGAKVSLEEKPTLIFDMENKSINGNTGCNMINGSITFDASSTLRKVAFKDVASTRKMCEPATMTVEEKLLAALRKTNSFRIINSNCIALYAEPSAIDLIVLKRL